MALAVPVLAWAYLNKVWVGNYFLGGDNNDFFYLLIYYFKNLINLVYPLWNPYQSWGSLDFLYTQDIGASNPFSAVIPFLLMMGVKAYWAYATYLVIFWILGFIGYYFLLHRLYQDPRIAWAGTSLLMFSAGLAVFFSWDILGLYIFVPLGWFFGFLIGFVQATDDQTIKRNMFGLTFSIMFIAHLYVPFYFLTMFLAFIISALLFASEGIIGFFKVNLRAIMRMPLAVIFCLLSILFSLWPTFDCYLKMKDPQNISEFYRGENEDKVGNAIVVSQQMIDIGGLPSRATFSELFSSYETGEQYLSYVPLMLFILALLTLFNRSSKPQRVIFMTGFLLMLVAMTNAAPIQHFLYKYVYFFRLFRNYFFFWILFWSCFVVYVMGETKQFMEWDFVAPSRKGVYALWVIMVHAGIAGYLMTLENVPMISYVTLFASCCWFLARLWEGLRLRQGIFIIGLVFIGLWQPFYVLPLIRGVGHGHADFMTSQGDFSYLRPSFGTGYNEKNPSLHRLKYFQDESGFGEVGYIGQKGSYELLQNLPQTSLAQYVRYKFILYDRTSLIAQKNIDWEMVLRVITFKDPSALIEEPSGLVTPDGKDALAPVIIKEPGPHFKIVHFDVNSISLSMALERRKFLVYNDSYHTGWHVLIDGKPAKLYLANIAFKGVWVDKGSHLVRFYFGSWFDGLRGWGVSLLFLFWLYLVLKVFLPVRKGKDDPSNV